MSFDWQTITAAGIVGWAALMIGLRIRQWAQGSGKSGCSSCPSKSNHPVIKTLPLVQISAQQKR